jgi:hypothetical protein
MKLTVKGWTNGVNNGINSRTGQPKSYTVRVSQHHIDIAEQDSQTHCMNAEGTRDRVPDAWQIRVTAETVKFNIGGDNDTPDIPALKFVYPVPGKAVLNVEQHDKEGPGTIKPYTFVLDGREATYAPVIRRGSLNKPKRKLKNRTRKSGLRRSCARRVWGRVGVSGPKTE